MKIHQEKRSREENQEETFERMIIRSNQFN